MPRETMARYGRRSSVRRALALTACAGGAWACVPGAVWAAAPGSANRERAGSETTLDRRATLERPEGAMPLARAVRAARNRELNGARATLRLDGPMTRQRAAALRAAGVRVLSYAGGGAHIANLAGADEAAVADLEFVTWAAPIARSAKIDPAIGRASAFASESRRQLAASGRHALLVTLWDDANAAQTAASLRAIPGVRVLSVAAPLGVMEVTATPGALDAIASLEDVAYVEESAEATLRNSSVRWIVQSNALNVTPLYANGLTGLGQIIGLQDGNPKEEHCAFDDSVAPGPSHRKFVSYGPSFPPTSVSNHGTHVAGTLAGDEGFESNTRGHAYEAKIAFRTFPSLADVANGTDFATNLQLNHNAGARVHSNSWGDDSTSTKQHYKGWSRIADKFSHDNEDDLIIFAITNTSTAFNNPENAKNILAVSAVGDTPNQNNWGSGGDGPTRELEHLIDQTTRAPLPGFPPELSTDTYARRKPDILAPGAGITSSSVNSFNDCSTAGLTGTSMATPAVTGVAALTREYFMDGFYPSGSANAPDALTPTGALLKAVILNSGQDVTGSGPFTDPNSFDGYPSDREGWGRLTIDRSLHFSGDNRTMQIVDIRHANALSLSTGEMNEHIVHVRDGAEQLRVTMTFTDPEPAPGALNVVVNDLDLEVISPTGAVFKGNVFNTTTGVSVTGGDFDERNNVEQVHVSSPTLGPWKVRVHGATVNQPSQGYAVVATGAIEVTCLADLDNDTNVDGADLAILLASWGMIGVSDLNADGTTDGADLAALLAAWGACP